MRPSILGVEMINVDNGQGHQLASIRERADQGRYPMTDGGEAERRPVRSTLRRRSRQRWAIAGGVLAGWLFLRFLTGSFLGATIALVAIGGIGTAAVVGLRAMGITRDHPLMRRIAARPWRDGQDVLHIATRHLPDVFVVTPHGSVFAPDLVELQMNPENLASLREWMELEVVSVSVTEVYEDEVGKRGARFLGSCRPEVYIVPDDSIPPGRFRLRRGVPAGDRYSYPADPWGEPETRDFDVRQYQDVAQVPAVTTADPIAGGRAAYALGPDRTVMDGMATVMEQVRPAIPPLRLVTGSAVSETRMSGARAGRGTVELELPSVPTVSRVHARFTFSEGQWWVANEGMNGLSVNGVQVSGQHPVAAGDSIRWGTRPDAPVSRVEIG